MPSPSVAPAGLFEAPSTSTNSGYAAPLPVGRFRPNCRTSGKRRLVVSFERMYKDKRAAVMTRHFAYPRNVTRHARGFAGPRPWRSEETLLKVEGWAVKLKYQASKNYR